MVVRCHACVVIHRIEKMKVLATKGPIESLEDAWEKRVVHRVPSKFTCFSMVAYGLLKSKQWTSNVDLNFSFKFAPRNVQHLIRFGCSMVIVVRLNDARTLSPLRAQVSGQLLCTSVSKKGTRAGTEFGSVEHGVAELLYSNINSRIIPPSRNRCWLD